MLDRFRLLFDSARVMHSIGQPNANGTKSSAARFHSIGKRNANCTKNACVFPASTHAVRLTRSMLLAFTWVFVTTRWIRSPMGEYRSGFYLLHRGLRFDSVCLRKAECQLPASICRNWDRQSARSFANATGKSSMNVRSAGRDEPGSSTPGVG